MGLAVQLREGQVVGYSPGEACLGLLVVLPGLSSLQIQQALLSCTSTRQKEASGSSRSENVQAVPRSWENQGWRLDGTQRA